MYMRIFHTSKERCHEIYLTEKLLAVFSTIGQINIYIFYLDCNTREI